MRMLTDLAKRTILDKVLKDRTNKIATDPKYNVYQIGLASTVYKIFDKKIWSGVNVNEVLAQELHKPVIKKFFKKEKRMWGLKIIFGLQF